MFGCVIYSFVIWLVLLVNRITTYVTYKFVTSPVTKFVNFWKFDILILILMFGQLVTGLESSLTGLLIS